MQTPHCGEGTDLRKRISGLQSPFYHCPTPHQTFPCPWFPYSNPHNSVNITKVHMGAQGLRELVGTRGSYNVSLCRASQIVVKFSPRQQQLRLSVGQTSNNRGQEASTEALSEHY